MTARLEAALTELAAAIRDELRTEIHGVNTGPDRLLSVREAADLMGIGRTTAYSEIASGRLRSVKVGRRRLVASSAVAERQRPDTKEASASVKTDAQGDADATSDPRRRAA